MRAFIISASLVVAVTQVGQALGEDADHIMPGVSCGHRRAIV
jgi:hypothetical protein